MLQQLSDEPMPPPQPQAQEDHGERKIWNEKAQSKIIFVMYSFVLCLLVSFSIWISPLIARHACHAWATSHVWHVQLDGSSRTYALPFGRVSKSACDKVQFMVNMCHHFILAPIPHLSLPYKVSPKQPKKGSRLPKKGKLVEKPVTVHAFGTVSLLLRYLLS